MTRREFVTLPWYESLGSHSTGGHEVDLLESGAEFFPALERAIAEAGQRIFVETYIFEDDPTGRRIAAALAAAARRGVSVHVVYDGFGTPELRGEVAQVLAQAGVRVEAFRPERSRFSLSRRRLRRLHRKIAVIDGRVAFVGGINLIDDLLDPNHGPLEHPRLDYAVCVRGPLVANAHVAVQRLWWELSVVNRPFFGRDPGRAPLQLPESVVSEVTRAGRTRARLVLRDNFRYRRAIERAYLQAIGAARRDVLIACAYFFPGVRFRRALVEAARRGVRVRLLLQGRVEYRLPHYGSQVLYDELLRAGIEIVEYRKSFLHAKAAVIDDWATVGSSNIDPYSLLLAREANVVVRNRRFAQRLRERLEHAIADGGERVELSSHARRPWPVRVLNWIGFVVLRIGVAITGKGGSY